MDSSASEIYAITISLVAMGIFLYFWVLVIKVLNKLMKLLDLKILESEIKLDQDKF